MRPLARQKLAMVLTLAMIAGTVPFFAFSVMAPLFRDDLAISPAERGGIVACHFIVSALFSPLAGSLADRHQPRPMLLALYGSAGTAIVAMAVAPNALSMAGALAIGGIPQALCHPVTNRALMVHALPEERGSLVGIKQSGGQIGALLAAATLPSLTVAFDSWRAAVVVCLLPVLAGLLLTVMVPAGGDNLKAERARVGTHVEGRIDLRRLTLYGFFMGGGVAATTSHLPSFGVDALEMSAQRSGLVVALMGVIAFASRIQWSRVLHRRDSAWRFLPRASAGAIAGVVCVLSSEWLGEPMLWIGAALMGATALTWTIGATLVILRSYGDNAGRATGRVMIGGNCGLIVSAPLVGATAELEAGYAAGWAVLALFFAAAAAITWRRPATHAPDSATASHHAVRT